MRKTLCLAGFASAALFVSNGFTQSPPSKPEPLTIPPTTTAPAAMPIPAAYYPPTPLVQPVSAPPPTVLPTPIAEWTPTPPATAQLITKVMSIGDVILQPGTSGAKHALEDRAERLTNLLEGFVSPASWTSAGGRGSMVYFATNHTLVVNNEERVVRDVESSIDALRDMSRPILRVSIDQNGFAHGALAKLVFNAKTTNLTPEQRERTLKACEAGPNAVAMPPMVKPEPKSMPVRFVAALPQPTKGPTACELVAEYRKACAEGRTDDAKALAVRALSLDPKCFTEK